MLACVITVTTEAKTPKLLKELKSFCVGLLTQQLIRQF